MHKYILKSSSYLLLSQFLVKAFAFGYTIFVAGNVGAEDFGFYSAALAIFGLMSLFADLGINRVLTRDIARDESNLGRLFSTSLLMRAFSAAIAFFVLTFFFYLTDPYNLRFALTTIALLSLIPQSVALTIDATFIALKKAPLSAMGFFLFNMVSFIVGAILIYLGYGVYGAMAAFLIGQIFYAAFFVTTLSIVHKINFKPFDFNVAKSILIKALPYGILSAIGFASFRFDTVLLSYIKGGAETGVYSLAYRFLEAATIIPVAFGTILYPVFSEHGDNKEKILKLFKQSLIFGGGAGVVITILYWTILPAFLNAFFPESFRGSAAALSILALAIPFIFMHIPLGQLLLSRESLLKQIILIYLFIFSVNLILMLTLLPLYGFIGAAWVTVIAEALTFFTFLIYVKRKVLN